MRNIENLNEDELALLWKDEKNYDAFDMLYRRLEKRFLSFFYLAVRDYHIAEELLNDTFIKIAKKIDTFRSESSFITWAYAIAGNLLRDYLRSKKRTIKSADISTIDPSYKLEFYNDDLEVLHICLGELDERSRVIVLNRSEGYPLREIAATFDISIERVRQIYQESLQTLRSSFQKHFSAELND